MCERGEAENISALSCHGWISPRKPCRLGLIACIDCILFGEADVKQYVNKVLWLLSLLCISWAGLVPSMVYAASGTVRESWSYEDLWQRVREVHPLGDIAKAELDDFKAKLKASEDWWLPRLSLSSSFAAIPGEGTKLNERSDFGNWGAYSIGDASLSLPVYTFGRVDALQGMAEAGVGIGRAKQDIAEQTMRAQLDQAVLAWLLAKELQRLLSDARSKIERAREQLEEREEADSDDYDPTDPLRLRIVELELDEGSLDAETLQRKAETGLRLLAKLPREHPIQLNFKLKDLLEAPLPSLEDCFALARENRPEVKAVEGLVAARSEGVALSKAQYLPNILVGGFTRYSYAEVNEEIRNESTTDTLNYFQGGAGVLLNWSFDWGAMNRKREESDAAYFKAQAQREALLLKLELEVDHALQDYRAAEKRRKFAKKAEKASRGIMVAKLDLYDSGIGELDPVSGAVKTYFEKRLKNIRSVHALVDALLKLRRTIGAPVE